MLKLKDFIEAARFADWDQVVANGGPPCFHLQENGRFCLRTPSWQGHGIPVFHDESVYHAYVSLIDLLRKVDAL
jgi:hypothetical protein